MAAETVQAIEQGPHAEVVTRLFEGAIIAALEEVDYCEALGNIDEIAASMLRQGIRAAIRQEAMHYDGDASFTRWPMPDDGEGAKMIEGLRSNYQAERRETQRAIAIEILSR